MSNRPHPTVERQPDGTYRVTIPPHARIDASAPLGRGKPVAMCTLEDDGAHVLGPVRIDLSDLREIERLQLIAGTQNGRVDWVAGISALAKMVKEQAESGEAKDAEAPQGLPLTLLSDMFAEPDEQVDWLVADLLPAGGVALLTAKPKVGKSTLARQLALSTARGERFLDRMTAQGVVIYLALEEKRSEVRKHFRDMGATGEEEIYVFASTAPLDVLVQIRTVIEEKKPALLIIDPLFRFTRVKDGNDYAQVTAALEPLIALARTTGMHVLCVHHEGKGDRQGGDAILGSTAIFAAVDTAISLKRTDLYRTIRSTQRYGPDLEETTLRFEAATRITTLGETKEREEESRIGAGILAYLEAKGDPMTEAEIDSDVEGKTRIRRSALRVLVAAGKIIRSGKGGKSDPFRYTTAATPIDSGGNNNPTDQARESTDPPSEMGVLVPLFPTIYREQENMNRKRDATPQKDGTDSCSRDFGKDVDSATHVHDPGNMNHPTCVGCRQPFAPMTAGASKTLCRVCQAELRRGTRL